MTNYTYRGGPDWFGRLMALGGIGVAAVALWYTYDQSQNALTRDDASAELKSNLAEWDQQFAELRRQQQDTDLDRTERFESLVARLETSLDDPDTEPPVQSSDPLDRMVSAAPPDTANSRLSLDDVDDDPNHLMDGGAAEPRPLPRESEGPQPALTLAEDGSDDAASLEDDDPIAALDERGELVVVRTAFRPSGEQDAVTTTIRNVGRHAAVIREVQFHPADVLQDVTRDAATRAMGASGTTQLVVRYRPEDNETVADNRHGVYVRRLTHGYTVPAGATIDILAGIDDPRHLGYGLRGDIVLVTESGDPCQIPGSSLAFIGQP